ncbi:glycoside hydrolase family 15 protein [Sphingomonas sp. CGMCC 1.13654]|uniref:Glycoside hydrolase family 15 protein n=1 Tax=Sphingomonas chungangi TaxID=2683589 RepID=A0A838L6T4_9SPHN|nr:glycoside hydrolase family 15 protein [Sphingomonas chungangi]MBA2935193.1 glycoside hydrolase family 15 protein [Sphingomonas chungangi]MVW55271.1 glycoside hydrolase family 15 protein [Sphingomonas chungangi]
MTSAIGDYALIGDGRTSALVASTGSVDFLCWPNFDSDACFAALLGDDTNGHWRIAPDAVVTAITRRYRGDTTILETDFTCDRAAVRIIDFMPWHDGPSTLVRIVEGLEGEVPVSLSLRLRFGYGQIAPWLRADETGFCAEIGPDRVKFDSAAELRLGDGEAAAKFTVGKGDRFVFILTYSPSDQAVSRSVDPDAALATTEREWRDWADRFDRPCHWPIAVKRSLVTLRALVDRRTGGMIAAASMGLPEIPGGGANWDYRYCWLRDSTFTLSALLNAGFHDEARRWRDWILRAIGGDCATMQIVYRIDGSRRLPEWEVEALSGYQGARPVRVGNAASGQTQLDVFGELMDSFDVAAKAGIDRTARVIEVETAIVRHLETAWDQPGADIWESRGTPRCYTYSQVMAWVGIDRFLKAHGDSPDVDRSLIARLETLHTQIHATVCERGYSIERGHFVQHYGSTTLDASLLLLPLVNFLPATDPRIVSTIAAIERDLVDGGLVRRKMAGSDEPAEGAFLACSCWLADCYKLQGRDDEAAAMLERVISLANDVGLLSEEYHVPTRQLIGNIPQALTHIGLINTALFLSGPVITRGGA